MADGELVWNGVELRRDDGTVWSWIESGWLDEPAEVRGEDEVLPGTPGLWQGNRVYNHRIIVMRTVLDAATPADLLALQQEFGPDSEGLWDPTAEPTSLVAGAGYRGLGVGVTATISVRCANVTPSPRRHETHAEYAVEVRAIGDTPNWSTETEEP